MELFSVLGNAQKLDGGAMFGNAPRALWQRWVNVDAENRIDLACRALLVKNLAGKTVLFETGIGAFFDPQLRARYGVQDAEHVLLQSLADVGVSHDAIDVVVLSHLHFDHAGGLLSKWQENTAPQLLFPRATYLVGAAHFARAKCPHPRDRASFIPLLQELLEASGRLELVDGAYSRALGQAVRFHFSDGHTPGLMLAEILGPRKNAAGDACGGVLFCADLIPGKAWVHVPITMGYDRFAEQLIDEKQALLAQMLARDVRLFFTHDSECAMARLHCDETGRYSIQDAQAHVHGWQLG